MQIYLLLIHTTELRLHIALMDHYKYLCHDANLLGYDNALLGYRF